MIKDKAPLPDDVEEALKDLWVTATPYEMPRLEFIEDGIRAHIAAQQDKIAALEADNKNLREERLKLDKRIHNQRVALRENWMIAEQRLGFLGEIRIHTNLVRTNILRAWSASEKKRRNAEAKIAALEADNKRLREALEFYAKSNNVAAYGKPTTDGIWNHFETKNGNGISIECGGTALAALAATTTEPNVFNNTSVSDNTSVSNNTCQTCGGRGFNDNYGHTYIDCPTCNGTGRKKEEK